MSPRVHHTESIIADAIIALQALAEVFQRRRETLARQAGLTVEQWRVLEEIAGESFMASLFARERRRSRAAVSKIIRQLLDKKIIETAVSVHDGRQRTYRLTPAGRATLRKLRRARREAIAKVWCKFDAQQLHSFTVFSRELCTRLEALSSPPRRSRAPLAATERKTKNG
ncbi:MAG: MarR family winged helix-turn-helix transcriptional regulator [Candidatus Sumerlaeaceae bacterium]|jgi:DNA-binding MarR family transcriptional regulator